MLEFDTLSKYRTSDMGHHSTGLGEGRGVVEEPPPPTPWPLSMAMATKASDSTVHAKLLIKRLIDVCHSCAPINSSISFSRSRDLPCHVHTFGN